MHILFTLLTIIVPLMFFDWHARMVFIAKAYPRRYGHGKSWKRAHKHYKNNHSFLERLFWIFAFKEKYEDKYKMIAYLAYAHLFTTIFTLCITLISLTLFPDSVIWIYVYIGNFVLWLIRFIYDNSIAKGK